MLHTSPQQGDARGHGGLGFVIYRFPALAFMSIPIQCGPMGLVWVEFIFPSIPPAVQTESFKTEFLSDNGTFKAISYIHIYSSFHQNFFELFVH